MSRRAAFFLSLTLLLAPLCFLAPPAEGQDRFADAEIKTHAVAEGIYMLEGVGGNLGVAVGDDGVFLVDDQYAPLTEKIKKAIAALSDQPIRFVLNTHWHGDHTGGNENLGEAGVLIVAHDKVRERMSVENFNELWDRTTPPAAPGALPVVTFSDSVTFHLGDEEIHAFHVPPAHTDGDSIIHFRTSNVVHMGDLFFNGMYPLIDVWSNGSATGYLAAIDQALALMDDETRVIPGHGPLSDKKGLQGFRDMIRTAHDLVKTHVAAGKSREEIVAAKPLASLDETWGQGYFDADSFVTMLFESLQRE